jgi:hypothetical protein
MRWWLLPLALSLTGCIVLDEEMADKIADRVTEEVDKIEKDLQPKPVPKEHANLVGHWTSLKYATLIIDEGGSLQHMRHGGVGSQFSAPIQSYDNGAIVAGVGPVKQTFSVDVAPTLVDGTWTMTVNGRVYNRAK